MWPGYRHHVSDLCVRHLTFVDRESGSININQSMAIEFVLQELYWCITLTTQKPVIQWFWVCLVLPVLSYVRTLAEQNSLVAVWLDPSYDYQECWRHDCWCMYSSACPNGISCLWRQNTGDPCRDRIQVILALGLTVKSNIYSGHSYYPCLEISFAARGGCLRQAWLYLIIFSGRLFK